MINALDMYFNPGKEILEGAEVEIKGNLYKVGTVRVSCPEGTKISLILTDHDTGIDYIYTHRPVYGVTYVRGVVGLKVWYDNMLGWRYVEN